MINDHTELIKFYCKLIHSFIIFEIFSINEIFSIILKFQN